MIVLFLALGFLVIALIVSFDVVGLTIAKSKYYADQPGKLKSWALLNGFWHAILLFVYGIFISGFIKIFEVNLDFLKDLFEGFENIAILRRIPDVVMFLDEHFPVIAGMIALIVIWQTYQEKVTDQPSKATRNNLGRLAKYLFDVFEIAIRIFCGKRYSQEAVRSILRSNIEAALVAVDMLALAILANRLEMMDGIYKIIGFSAVVFFVVAGLCYVAGRWGVGYFSLDSSKPRLRGNFSDGANQGRLYADPDVLTKQWWLVTLRLLEPWLIFYFALELLSVLLFGEQTHSPGYIFGTSLMLYAVVRSVGLKNIVCAAIADHSPNQTPSGVREVGRSISSIFLGLIAALITAILGFIALVTLACLAIAVFWEIYVATYQEDQPAFDAMLFFSGMWITIIAFGAQFAFDGAKEAVAKALDWLGENYFAFIFSLSAVAIAVAVPIFHDLRAEAINNTDLEILSDEFWRIVLNDMHVHAAQVLLSLVWVLGLSMIIPAIKPRKFAAINGGDPIDASWRDIVMVHGQKTVLIWPLMIVGLTMGGMIWVNQYVFDQYCAGFGAAATSVRCL